MDQYSFFGDESKIFFQITFSNGGITAVYTRTSFTYFTIQTHVACSVSIIRTSEPVPVDFTTLDTFEKT